LSTHNSLAKFIEIAHGANTAREAQTDMAKIGIDLGGTRIKVARVIADNILEERSIETPKGGPNAVLGAIAECVKGLDASPGAVGFAIPGEVDAAGKCYRLPNIDGFEGVAIASILEPLLGCRVFVENDGNAAAHGEALYGWGQKYKSFAMVTLGTGIGGGLVLDGKLRPGTHGFAAEIGHIPIDSSSDAWPCACGQRGCVESYAGTKGLLRRYKELGGETVTEVAHVAAAAREGKVAGVQAFQMMADALARCVTTMQNLLDLDAIVFTGGISQSFDMLLPPLREAVRKAAFAAPLGEVPLVLSEMGSKAGVVGSAHLDLVKR
jgi:glucokinase